MRVFCPAKINLYLRILGKRADGFHDLDTLMAPLTLGDDLELEPTAEPGVRIHCNMPGVPLGPENLVWKALEIFASRTGTDLAYEVMLTKRIPAGAGLGGGSSNAAGALRAANQVHGNPLSMAELAAAAGEVGSDVAFFCAGAWAVCRGRGEIVDPVPAAGKYEILLVKPPFPVSTPWAYRHWAASQPLLGVDYAPQLMDGLALVNDLERPVFAKHLLLPHLKAWLRAQPEVRAALMSGSGSTTFAVLEDGRDCAELIQRLQNELGKHVWVERCAIRSDASD